MTNKRRLIIASIVLVLVAVSLVLLRARPPLTPEQVANRVLGCYVHQDFACVWNHASDSERAIVSKKAFVESMRRVHADHFKGRLAVEKKLPPFFATSGAVSVSAIVKDESGRRFMLPVAAAPTEGDAVSTDGCAYGVMVAFLEVDGNDQVVQNGPTKVSNRLSAFRYADRALAPLGLEGAVFNSSLDRMTKWSDLVAKFERVEAERSAKD